MDVGVFAPLRLGFGRVDGVEARGVWGRPDDLGLSGNSNSFRSSSSDFGPPAAGVESSFVDAFPSSPSNSARSSSPVSPSVLDIVFWLAINVDLMLILSRLGKDQSFRIAI